MACYIRWRIKFEWLQWIKRIFIEDCRTHTCHTLEHDGKDTIFKNSMNLRERVKTLENK